MGKRCCSDYNSQSCLHQSLLVVVFGFAWARRGWEKHWNLACWHGVKPSEQLEVQTDNHLATPASLNVGLPDSVNLISCIRLQKTRMSAQPASALVSDCKMAKGGGDWMMKARG